MSRARPAECRAKVLAAIHAVERGIRETSKTIRIMRTGMDRRNFFRNRASLSKVGMIHRKRKEIRKELRGQLIRRLGRPPFRDELGRKRWFERFARAQPHLVCSLRLKIDGWPCWSRPLRVIFLSDFHTGSHSDDVARLQGIVAKARTFDPDLVLFGGDFVNMQPFAGGGCRRGS